MVGVLAYCLGIKFDSILLFRSSMTNSKQYCDHCGERWRHGHDPCDYKKDPVYIRIRLNGKRVSTARLSENGSVFEIFPGFYIPYPNVEEWKKKHMVEGATFEG
jgi:hypothetical protein